MGVGGGGGSSNNPWSQDGEISLQPDGIRVQLIDQFCFCLHELSDVIRGGNRGISDDDVMNQR